MRNTFYSKLLLLLIIFLSIPFAQAEMKPLPAEQAFVFSAYLETPMRLIAEWHIAPGYALYRDKLHIKAEPAAALSQRGIQWPASQKQVDPVSGSSLQIYTGQIQLVVPLAVKTSREVTLAVQYQGCSQSGFCYAPLNKSVHVTYPFGAEGLKQAPLLTISDQGSKAEGQAKTTAFEPTLLTDQNAAQAFLGSHTGWVTLLCFLGLGLLLAFTPCTLPMIPILSSLILGRKNLKPWEAFQYSLAYVLGMALTYALAGILVAWAGSSVQAYFQNPWIISAFSLLFIVLALSTLDLFELRLPAFLRQRLLRLGQQQKGGNLMGDFLMGSLSSLIVSPCVTAPLVGVLAYVAETGSLFLGFGALFALGLGMGLPLILMGLSAGKYLPQAGPWMEGMQKFFAFLLFGMAIWMLGRILPGGLTLFLWAALLLSAAIYLFFIEGLSGRKKISAYLGGGLCLSYAFVLFFGVALNHTSPLYPFEEKLTRSDAPSLNYIEPKSFSQLNQLLKEAKQAHKPVMLNFYAEWCASCQALESAVMSAAEVQAALSHFLLLRANVTENNAFDQALLKRYHVFAPPTFLFFNSQGQEVMDKRSVGEVDRHFFLARAKTI